MMSIFRKKLVLIIVSVATLLAVTGCSFVNRSVVFLRRVTTSHNSKIVECSLEDKFYYNQLSEEKKRDYRLLLAAYQRMDEEVCGLTVRAEDMIELNKQIILDCPELFWVANSGIYYSEVITPIVDAGGRYEPIYRFTREEAESHYARIHSFCVRFAAAHSGESDYEKALAAYDYIVNNTDYDVATAENIISKGEYDPVKDRSQCIESVFIEEFSVCAGYSAAYQLLLRYCGIYATSVIGSVHTNTEADAFNHQWNLLRLDGNYYYSDITWGEPEEGETEPQHIYFCLTSDEFNQSHIARDWAIYPEATAIDCNYYYREGGYLTEFNLYQVGEYVRNAVANHDAHLVLKFANRIDFVLCSEYLRYNKGRIEILQADFSLGSNLGPDFNFRKTTYNIYDYVNIIKFNFDYNSGGDTIGTN